MTQHYLYQYKQLNLPKCDVFGQICRKVFEINYSEITFVKLETLVSISKTFMFNILLFVWKTQQFLLFLP